MFTGIIEQLGRVIENTCSDGVNRLVVSTKFKRIEAGESIAINGTCLTALPGQPEGLLAFDVSPETLALTTLSKLSAGDMVNLERAMLASARFGGHYVSGHVDTCAVIQSLQSVSGCVDMVVSEFVPQAMAYLVAKGSITIDGVSLTINAVMKNAISVMLVPHTLKHTTLGSLTVGTKVNIEFDYLTRVVAHQLRLQGHLDYEVN